MEIYENQQIYSMGSQCKVGAALSFMSYSSAFWRFGVFYCKIAFWTKSWKAENTHMP